MAWPAGRRRKRGVSMVTLIEITLTLFCAATVIVSQVMCVTIRKRCIDDLDEMFEKHNAIVRELYLEFVAKTQRKDGGQGGIEYVR